MIDDNPIEVVERMMEEQSLGRAIASAMEGASAAEQDGDADGLRHWQNVERILRNRYSGSW